MNEDPILTEPTDPTNPDPVITEPIASDNADLIEHLERIEGLMENQQILVSDIVDLLADLGIFFIAFAAVAVTFYVLLKEALRW